MLITNIRTGLSKIVNLENYTSEELFKIYKFYHNNKDFAVLTKF